MKLLCDQKTKFSSISRSPLRITEQYWIDVYSSQTSCLKCSFWLRPRCCWLSSSTPFLKMQQVRGDVLFLSACLLPSLSICSQCSINFWASSRRTKLRCNIFCVSRCGIRKQISRNEKLKGPEWNKLLARSVRCVYNSFTPKGPQPKKLKARRLTSTRLNLAFKKYGFRNASFVCLWSEISGVSVLS